ncbi:YceI family protein [Confluentibacter flavum]|uniref:Lipid/polyisoprenoid-binding YceI-like domain-containing protein n=1 Tax=Confluentibacter flavum TaxID=1909700 RepID=A0A2N3HHR7_9FLAO|nr:YceI family protein [Confluentibacter flavum]PKQ44443.1 hypothetical protein CSW08_13610 [Confluentibacter flavum]
MKIRLFLVVLICSVYVGNSQGSYKLSNKSILKINGSSTLHDWVVTANSKEGSMIILDGGKPNNLKIQVEVAQIKSEPGAAMDKKMHVALKEEECPNIYFESKVVKKMDGMENTYLVTGILNIAGVGLEIDIKSILKQFGGGYILKGFKEIKLRDFNIEPPTAMFGQIVVGELVTIDFNLIFE